MVRLDSDSPQMLACGEFIVKSATMSIRSEDFYVDGGARNKVELKGTDRNSCVLTGMVMTGPMP